MATWSVELGAATARHPERSGGTRSNSGLADVARGAGAHHRDALGPVMGFMRAIWELDHALESASKRMKKRIGVSGPERLALRVIGQLPDISPGELADVMHVDPSSLTALLKRLVRRRLIVRRTNRDDARKAHLKLTPEGEALDGIRAGTVEAGVRAALDALHPRDVGATVAVLGAIARSLDHVGRLPPRAPRRRKAPPRRRA